MSIKIHANRVLGTIHVTKNFLGVFKGAQIKSGTKAPTDLNAALVPATHRRFTGDIATEACFHILFTQRRPTGDELSAVENCKIKLKWT